MDLSRTEMLIGRENIEKLQKSHVAIFGLGGVGGYVTEALARSGIGKFDLIDSDRVEPSNINRQIIATEDTIGEKKTDVMKRRILSINKDAIVNTYDIFYLPETKDLFDFRAYDYIVDAIDTVTGKLTLIEEAERQSRAIISSMGAGNKLDPTLFCVSDIYSTRVDPLARVMRRELKKRGIKKLKVVYSTEEPIKPSSLENGSTPGSISFIPSVCGLIIASEVIKDLIRSGE